jgi:DNA polymerase III sliding clamp (beta) subunit (PCNA family)
MPDNVQFSLDIESAHFAAVAVFRAKKDVRVYLQGVALDCGPSGAYIVATDGHAVAVHKVTSDPLPSVSIILPEMLAARIEKAKFDAVRLSFEGPAGIFSGETRRKITALIDGAAVTVEEMEGRYPDWRRVAKHTPADAIRFYNADLVAKVYKASAKFRGKDKNFAVIHPGGDGPGFVSLDHGARTCAWVMPLRLAPTDLPSAPSFTF